MSYKTYHVGTNGYVKRLDNLSGSWIDVSVPGYIATPVIVLYDVMTDPNDPTKVFVVGDYNGTSSIWKSSNSGSSWSSPGGTHTN